MLVNHQHLCLLPTIAGDTGGYSLLSLSVATVFYLFNSYTSNFNNVKEKQLQHVFKGMSF